MKIEIKLPFPNMSVLSPNARKHWRVKEPFIKGDRQYAALMAGKHKGKFDGSKPIALDLTFYPPTGHHRDDDNMIAATKHMRDGLADGLGVNDKMFRISNVTIGEIVKGGCVIVTLTQGENHD